MTVTSAEQTILNNLITLKKQYEQALAEADTVSAHYREQLSHVNALVLNQLGSVNDLVVPLQAHIKSAEPTLAEIISQQNANQVNRLTLAPAPVIPETILSTGAASEVASSPQKAKTAKTAKTEDTQPIGGRIPRELLPIHQGLKRLDAIAKIFQSHPGQDVTIDTLTQELFGNLSAAAHKAERLKLRTLLYQGEQRGLWRKGSATSTYTMSASGQSGSDADVKPSSKGAAKNRAQTKSKATKASPGTATAKKRISLPLLPTFQGMTKLEAITAVLAQYRGEVLHHDTIIQSLYGDLSPSDLKDERVRIKTALLGGVKNGKWQKASVASSYFLENSSAGTKSKSPTRGSSASKASTSSAETVAQSAEAAPETLAGAKKLSSKKSQKSASAKAPTRPKAGSSRKAPTQSKAKRT
jgi:hypothetical protein